MGKVHILLYYKFVQIDKPEQFVEEHLEKCKKIRVLGKVLVANEGINGSVSGTKKEVEAYKKMLTKDERFSDVVFKEEVGEMHPFTKMSVKLRKEIIRLDKEVNMEKRGKNLTPREFLELYNKNEDVVILDARNDYESRVGKFKGAITPGIKTFREFPKVAEMLQDKKDKKIVMYCTGGIRCEKASAYLIEQGFKDVSQLEGGIITFCQQCPGTVWEGKCFVFDKRLLSDVDFKNKPITNCNYCDVPCDLYRNCKNPKCNLFTTVCTDCEKNKNGCCSPECFEEYKKLLLKKAKDNSGKKGKK